MTQGANYIIAKTVKTAIFGIIVKKHFAIFGILYKINIAIFGIRVYNSYCKGGIAICQKEFLNAKFTIKCLNGRNNLTEKLRF
jgi:hypothetical protein